MNDDREAHLKLLSLQRPAPLTGRVLGFAPTGRERPLFAGWVGRDGNVVPLKAPTRKVRLEATRITKGPVRGPNSNRHDDDEWI
jgi:hypothetical protein